MIYIDNPVGSGAKIWYFKWQNTEECIYCKGFSHTYTNAFVTNEDEVARNLYNMLEQWFNMFPEYQANNFFAFGESYAGKLIWINGPD